MGKTSLIKNAAEASKVHFVYFDVSKAANLSELVRQLMQAAPAEKGAKLSRSLEIAGKFLKSVGVSAGKITITGELRESDAHLTLEGVLNSFNERAADNDEAWTVCLDEFQEIRSIGGDRIDWQLRGIMQSHRNLNYIFTGSDHRILGWMTHPTAPFFKQLQQIEVGPIPREHIAQWIEKRAKQGGLPRFPYGQSIVDIGGPCTGDIVRLAKTVFEFTAAGKEHTGVVNAALDSISLKELAGEFSNYWRTLAPGARVVLRAIATGKAPSATSTLREYGLSAASTATSALDTLVEKQFLVRTDDKVDFDSPFFRRWVNFNALP